ncbi:MAG: diaminopimelate decarboxylase family protein, partial [Bacilli bacterium]
MIRHEVINNELYIDGIKVSELVKKYESPLYVISYSQLKENINNLKKSFVDKYDNVRVHYACKANFSKGIAQIMALHDFGLDVVSKGEIYTAKEALFDLSKVEYNGNNKTYSDLEYAISNGIGYIIADNEFELADIDELSKIYQTKQKVLLRITPNVSDGAHSYINTGQTDSKFGIPTINDNFIRVFKDALNYKNIYIVGIHFHIGSQLSNSNTFIEALDFLQLILKQIKELYEYEAKIINIGGGLGIEYTKDDRIDSVDAFYQPIMNYIEKLFKTLEYHQRPTIVTEPGRYIIGEAGITLYEIGHHKEVPGICNYVSVNGGMCDNI